MTNQRERLMWLILAALVILGIILILAQGPA